MRAPEGVLPQDPQMQQLLPALIFMFGAVCSLLALSCHFSMRILLYNQGIASLLCCHGCSGLKTHIPFRHRQVNDIRYGVSVAGNCEVSSCLAARQHLKICSGRAEAASGHLARSKRPITLLTGSLPFIITALRGDSTTSTSISGVGCSTSLSELVLLGRMPARYTLRNLACTITSCVDWLRQF